MGQRFQPPDFPYEFHRLSPDPVDRPSLLGTTKRKFMRSGTIVSRAAACLSIRAFCSAQPKWVQHGGHRGEDEDVVFPGMQVAACDLEETSRARVDG